MDRRKTKWHYKGSVPHGTPKTVKCENKIMGNATWIKIAAGNVINSRNTWHFYGHLNDWTEKTWKYFFSSNDKNNVLQTDPMTNPS